MAIADTPLDQVLEVLTAILEDRVAQEETEPVVPLPPASALAYELNLTLPEHGHSFEEVGELLGELVQATPSTTSPRFFNQLFGRGEPAAFLGEAVTAALNSSMYTYKVGGPQVLVELELIEAMGRLMGYEGHEGIFTPGGSMSNLYGMLLARDRVCPDFIEQGADGRRLRVYSSADAHYSITKAASTLGIGRGNVVKLGCDERGRLRPELVREAIERDLAAGHVPMMINATAGTTVLGAFDPLEPLADLAEQYGLWLHVDGALGGSMIFERSMAPCLAGSARADSITWNAHKLMGVPLSCSVLLVREAGRLQASMDESADYLFQSEADAFNPGVRSLQCGRRNDALKLWAAWQRLGTEGYRERMSQLRELARHAAGLVEADPDMRLVREPESVTVCFTVADVPADVLCARLSRQCLAMVGYATVDDTSVVRLALVGGQLEPSDLVELFASIRKAAGLAPLRANADRRATGPTAAPRDSVASAR